MAGENAAAMVKTRTRIRVFQADSPEELERQFDKWANEPEGGTTVIPYLNMMSLTAVKMLSPENAVAGMPVQTWTQLHMVVPYRVTE